MSKMSEIMFRIRRSVYDVMPRAKMEGEWGFTADDFEDALKLMKDGEWVKCTERLPDDRELHYVTIMGGGLRSRRVCSLWYCKNTNEWLTVNCHDLPGTIVVAWMERPEPYLG